MEDKFNFSGIEAAEATVYVQPGTIGLFKIAKVEFGESSKKKTAQMTLTFELEKSLNEQGTLVDDQGILPHNFYMTAAAMKRVQYFSKVLFDEEIKGDAVTTVELQKRFEGKKVALKVSGIVSDKGKGYGNLAYAGFAMKAAEFIANPKSLQFTSGEKADIKDALDAIKESRASNADSEGGSAAAGGAAEPTRPGKAF